MKLMRFILVFSMFFNCLAAGYSAEEIVVACQDTIVVPTSVFSVLLGCNLPLELVTRLIEQEYPTAAHRTGNNKQEQKQHQSVSDICSLIPQKIEQRTCTLSPAIPAGELPVFRMCINPRQYSYRHFDQCQPPGTDGLILLWLIIVSLMNLPVGVFYLHSSGIRSPSGNWRAFSIIW